MVLSRLSALQHDLAAAMFSGPTTMVLTGGAALAGFHLGHRTTKDLDLFGDRSVDLQAEESLLELAATQIGATMEHLRSLPYLRQVAVRRGAEVTTVDLVRDTAPRVEPPRRIGGVLLDTMREIAANKLVALLGRAEPRDLVDLRAMLGTGLDLDQALADALTKDGGADVATLAWLMSEWSIGSAVVLPGGVGADELERFRAGLERALRARALPWQPRG